MEKHFNSTADGQKVMASRASRIALLLMIAGKLRAKGIATYGNELLSNLPDTQIDTFRDELIADWDAANSKP